MFRKGFTIVEIIIAVTISSLLLAGTVGAASKAIEALGSTKQKSRTYSAFTDAVSRLTSLRASYPVITSVSAPTGYDYLIFTNSGQTAGVLVGIVDAGQSTLLLDPVSAYSTYGQKVLAVQDLTASQVVALIASPPTAYTVVFREESLYRNVVVESFKSTSYNSGTLFDVVISLYTAPRPELNGKPKASFPDFPSVMDLVL